MAKEIERKYRIFSEAWKTLPSTAFHIKQGYLSFADENTSEVRVRIQSPLLPVVSPSNDNEIRGFLTVKNAGSLVRQETECVIPFSSAQSILSTCSAIIDKTRHIISMKDCTVEVDVYEGCLAGLIIAEVELPHENALFSLPSWFGPEVTQDPRYKNSHLAQASTFPEVKTKSRAMGP